MKKKINEWFDQGSLSKREWIFAVCIMVILSSFYIYGDLEETTASGINVWKCIEEGKLYAFDSQFYPGVENSWIVDGVRGGAYDFFVYIIFAIYNFPMWIWEKITGLSVFATWPTRIYIKGITWIFSGISALLVYKIALLCKVEKKNANWCVALFLSCGLFAYTQVVVGGYDIISVAFTLLGIYEYLKERTTRFLISFSMAIAFKLFAFWIFIPLLLLRDKKIQTLIWKTAASFSVVVAPRLCFFLVGGVCGGGGRKNKYSDCE